MKEVVREATEAFSPYPLFIKVEEYYSDLRLNPVKFEKAKYINVTLVINTRDEDDDEAGFEYRIGIGAEIKYGDVVEYDLEESIKDFQTRCEECVTALAEGGDVDSVIGALSRAADEEYERLAKEIEEKAKKMRPLYIIGALLFIVGVCIMFFLATRG